MKHAILSILLGFVGVAGQAQEFTPVVEDSIDFVINGTTTSDYDLLIGCTSVAEDMVMVTQNVKDFKNIKGIKIENWIDDIER